MAPIYRGPLHHRPLRSPRRSEARHRARCRPGRAASGFPAQKENHTLKPFNAQIPESAPPGWCWAVRLPWGSDMNYQDGSLQAKPDLQPQYPQTFIRLGEYRQRSKDIPRSFVPSAKGLFVPSQEVLRAAGYTPGSKHPRHWARGNERRRRLFGNGDCRVYGFGKWWVLQRRDGVDSHTQVLVFSLGPWLIATRTYAAAIRLAEYCSPHAPDPLGLYSWQNTR